MNGRVLANAGVFALGIILIAGGAWGIARGSAYVQLEWGWTSVISGSVALTGGVLTLALGFVLQRLDGLQGALLRGLAGASPVARRAEAPAGEKPATEPMPLGIEAAAPAAYEPGPDPTAYAEPALQAAAAVNVELLAHEQRPAAAEHAEAHPSPQPPEVIHAADQGPADDMVKAAGVSDEPELDAAIEELLAEQRGTAPHSAAELSSASVPEPIAELQQSAPGPEAGESAKGPQRAGGWRGLFSRKERRAATAPATEQHVAEPTWESQAVQPAEEPEPVPSPEHEHATSPALNAGIPRTGDDWFDRALSGRDETYEPPGQGSARDVRHDGERDHARDFESPAPAAEEPPTAAPAAEPAVIGRYTSGNTTYVMFADGSIEAETPNGVLHFASLADLKVYVEGGQ